MNDVEDAVRQTGFAEEFGDANRRARIALGRLENESVTTGNGNRVHPHRHHHREIERGDTSDHAERLAHAPVVDTASDLFGIIALEQVWDATGKFNDFDAALDFALRVGKHLAVLLRN